MKLIKYITLSFFVIFGLMRCASTQKLQNKPPFEIGQITYTLQNANNAVDSIYVPMTSNPKQIILDSIYFKGKRAKLIKLESNVYVGRFPKQDMVMSNKPLAEHENTLPEVPIKLPFDLKDDECVISYSNNSKIYYLKL